MTNLDRVLKSRDIVLLTKLCLVKATVFPVVMYGCESWTIKKAEHRRIDPLELSCWRRLFIKPVNPKGHKSWISIRRTDAEAEAPCFGYLVQKPDSLEKTLILGKSEDGRRREQQRMSWLDGIINSMDMGLRKLQELVCIDRWPMPLLLFIHWQMLFTSAKL